MGDAGAAPHAAGCSAARAGGVGLRPGRARRAGGAGEAGGAVATATWGWERWVGEKEDLN